MPKGVVQTHGMMCAVIAAQEALRTEPQNPDEIPQSLEWMPWNHISAGNIGFNNQINAGGTIYLDAGKPLPGMFDETIRNLRDITPLGIGHRAHRLRLAVRRDGARRKPARPCLQEAAHGRLRRSHAQPGHL